MKTFFSLIAALGVSVAAAAADSTTGQTESGRRPDPCAPKQADKKPGDNAAPAAPKPTAAKP